MTEENKGTHLVSRSQATNIRNLKQQPSHSIT